MSNYSREDLMALAAGYALGALTADEKAAVESAMVQDAELRREVAAYHDVAGTILRSEPPMTPPASLRERWLARVRGSGGGVSSSLSRAESRARPGFSARTLGTLLAASLVLAAALGVQLQRSRTALETERSALAVAREAAEKRERQLNTVLEAENGLMVAMLKGTGHGETGVQVYWNARQKRGMLHAFHLTPAPAGRAYQLWVIRDGTPISSRVFNSDADGHALVEQLELPDSAEGISVVAITVEPEGGSPQPTSAPIMTGTLMRATQQ